jgi:hypothetical protein
MRDQPTSHYAVATTCRQPGHSWTVVLRGRPALIGEGRQEGCRTMFELICYDCGDDPGLDYCEVSPEFQRMRGPYLIAEGITAYREHVGLHHRRQVIPEPGQPMSDVHGR